jgi:predicted  nucleic acid-binding Zn-ribbon protein
LRNLRHEIKQDIQDLRNEMKRDIQDIRQDMQNFKVATEKELSGIRQEMKDLKNEMIVLQDKLIIKMGSFMALGIGLLATLITVLHLH